MYHEASDGPGPWVPGGRRPIYFWVPLGPLGSLALKKLCFLLDPFGPLWDPWPLNICFLRHLWTLWAFGATGRLKWLLGRAV